jgi:hypothetical protein
LVSREAQQGGAAYITAHWLATCPCGISSTCRAAPQIGQAAIFPYFAGGFGHNTVRDFGHDDRIEFDGGVFQNFAAVEAASHQVGNDTVITLTRAIVLQHVSISSLHASNFLFA